jgi:hypothetical protein
MCLKAERNARWQYLTASVRSRCWSFGTTFYWCVDRKCSRGSATQPLSVRSADQSADHMEATIPVLNILERRFLCGEGALRCSWRSHVSSNTQRRAQIEVRDLQDPFVQVDHMPFAKDQVEVFQGFRKPKALHAISLSGRSLADVNDS